jgi:hypothetical protein
MRHVALQFRANLTGPKKQAMGIKRVGKDLCLVQCEWQTDLRTHLGQHFMRLANALGAADLAGEIVEGVETLRRRVGFELIGLPRDIGLDF